MRTITKNHSERLQAQLEEAKTLNLTKIASSLENQEHDVRDDDGFYVYAESDLNNDLNKTLWDAVVRISDYLGQVPDAVQVQEVVDKYAEDLFREICVLANVPDGVGIYEPNLPGEVRKTVVLEVEEND